MIPHAIDPAVNATVFASAGTGKTWQLVARLLRLLLAGARPDGILAVTFTRAAASEMRLRLVERLRGWQFCNDGELRAELAGIGLPDADDALLGRARSLYEQLLFAPEGVRTTTFHAFCQELLRRFPLEADVPPGFELADNVGELIDEARDALYSEAALAPEGAIAGALATLFEETGTAESAAKALRGFIAHRSDWWAWTADETDPVAFAEARLHALLAVDEEADPVGAFVAARRIELGEYAELLGRNTAGDRERAAAIADALAADDPVALVAVARKVLLRVDGEPRVVKESATQRKRLGDDGERRLVELHASLSAALLDTIDRMATARNLALNRAWLTAGHRLLDHFQRLKAERRLLDYTDLEWRACRLLNEGEHAHWIQYKLDARIDHLLVDEFQDTNPTQWRLLLPLLEEMAAGDDGRGRSIFLVGDTKQSIYGFRRARPELQETADRWLRERLGGRRFPLDRSRRSSPAVTGLVNLLFAGDGGERELLPGFAAHETHRTGLWGRVEVWPQAGAEEEEDDGMEVPVLRDPLAAPRPQGAPSAHAREAELVAARIGALVAGEVVIGEGAGARHPGYGDITILVRKRTHVAAIERALRRAQIPFVSADRGTLLAQIEVEDVVTLLTLMVAPFDDLALARLLRSPLFAASDDDLATIAAEGTGHWWGRLHRLAAEGRATAALERAARLLAGWRRLAGRLPIHDLLDRIFHEGDLLARYRAASLPHRRAQAEAALVRFLELALEVDSGRYPSLSRFLMRVASLRAPGGDEAPDAPPQRGAGARVRIMTVHGAKGLQAPIVFLCDTHFAEDDRSAWSPVVEWPVDDPRPSWLLLVPRRGDCCQRVATVLERRRTEEERAGANLLYVALTRAEQMVVVTAARSGKKVAGSWHETITRAVEDAPCGGFDEVGRWSLEVGKRPAPAAPPAATVTPVPVPAVFVAPPLARSETEAGPMANSGDDAGLLRGTAIHRLLDLLTGDGDREDGGLVAQVAAETGLARSDPRLAEWLAEARSVVTDDALADLFDQERHDQSWNEVAIACCDRDGEIKWGIIDRMVKRGESLLIVDYKTHRIADAPPPALVASYGEQMERYSAAAAALWPGLRIDRALLFTASRRLVRLD